MITFDSLTLKAFIQENKDFFIGCRIQKIQQPTRRELLFSLRNNGETRKFYVNINPQFHHLCFINAQTEQQRALEIPLKPPMFCMQLRKYLENAKIVKINQPNYERIFEIYVETFNELQEKIELCLAIELMGKHSNIVLYNADTNIIIGCAHNVGSEKSREREMAGTLPYIYPPKQHKLDILNIQGEIIEPLENFYFFSKAFANQCKNRSLDELKTFVILQSVAPAISADFNEFTLFEQLLQNATPKQNVNEMIDEYFAHHIQKNKLKSLSGELYTLANKKLSKHKKNHELMQEQLKKETESQKYRKFGDLIMANLYNLADFTPQITVLDWETNTNITIELDTQLSIKDNANKFYKRYNKSKKTTEKISEMLAENEIQLEYFAQTLYSINNALSIEELQEIKNELLPIFQPAKKEKLQATQPLETEVYGHKVYIGRNNRQNDLIVSKLSKDEDYWFHTHGCAGSHLLLKCPTPTDEIILKCAQLAKEYSSAKNSSKVGVIYTKRKNLKKPPKAPLGYVTYKGEQEIIID